MRKVDFDQYTENYNELLKEGTKFFSEDEAYFARYKVNIVKERLRRRPERVLEFGCGIGRNIAFLKQAFSGAVIEGSDVSQESLNIAQSENPDVKFWMEGERRADANAYDLIFVAGVFHHINPSLRDEVLTGLFDSSAHGADIFVFEHNPYNPVTRRIVNNCPYDEDAVLLRPAELVGLIRRAGFVVSKRRFALFFPPRLGALVRLERFIEWMPLGGQYWVHARKG